MSTTQETGEVLLELQELDLAIARDKKALSELPELKELAAHRRTYQKLKTAATRLLAQRKDVETDLSDLDEQERDVDERVERAQARLAGGTGYRLVQDTEQELTEAAKQLDKIEFARQTKTSELEEMRRKERQLSERIERCEEAVREDTRAARARATELQGSIDEAAARRERLFESLPPETQTAYTAALERFDGLAVERLDGSVPGICRTTLSPASLADVRKQGPVGTCPYCHRIIVLSEGSQT